MRVLIKETPRAPPPLCHVRTQQEDGVYETGGRTSQNIYESRSFVSNSLRPHRLYRVHGILQARILEWVAFPFSRGSSQPRDWTQVSHIANRFLYQLSQQGNPRILEWVAYPFSSRSSQPRDQTRVSWMAGGFFNSWATRQDLIKH